MAIPPNSSLGQSVHAYQPYYAPPTFPQTNYIEGSSPFATINNTPASQGTTGSTTVNARFRRDGMNWLYSRGAQVKKWFRMIATGEVESTKFQPVTSITAFSMFNGQLYKAGFPRNLGWSEKVPTIPPAALGTAPSQMTPTPRWTRSIYTNRSFATAPAIPAQPKNG